MNKFLFFIVIVQLFSCSPSPSNIPPTLSEEGSASIDNYLKDRITSKQIPGIVAIVVNNKEVIYKNAFGMNSWASHDSLKADDIFTIASMTKAVTAVAVMQLYDQGRISLNDSVTKYLPAVSGLQVVDKFNGKDTFFTTIPVQRPITIHDLLTHTSGLGYPFGNRILALIEQKGFTGKQPDIFMNYPLVHQPGAKWTYGFNYEMLGTLVEKVSGMTLDKYCEENIFRRLGMNNTWFNVPEKDYDRLTNFYARVNDSLAEQPSPGKQKEKPNGGAGLYSTAEDYAKLLQMFLGEGNSNQQQIIKHDSFHEMTKNQIGGLFIETQPGAIPGMANDFPARPGKDKFGYGFVITTDIDNDGSKRKPGSYHWAGLFNTYYWVDNETGIAAIIMMQVLPFYDKACIETLDNYEALIYKDLNEK